MKDYRSVSYNIEIKESVDNLIISKDFGSDWLSIKIVTNDSDNGTITFRSEVMAEQLYHALGQLLKKAG